MADLAHCDKHDAYDSNCPNCGIRRLVQVDRADSGCRCPVFFPDYCPVHVVDVVTDHALRAATEALKAEHEQEVSRGGDGPPVQTYDQLARIVLRAVAADPDVREAVANALRQSAIRAATCRSPASARSCWLTPCCA